VGGRWYSNSVTSSRTGIPVFGARADFFVECDLRPEEVFGVAALFGFTTWTVTHSPEGKRSWISIGLPTSLVQYEAEARASLSVSS